MNDNYCESTDIFTSNFCRGTCDRLNTTPFFNGVEMYIVLL